MPIRGIFIGRPLVAGALTMTAFAFRAISKFWMNPVIEFFINPIVVFLLFLLAGIIILYPFLKGKLALVLGPLLVIVIAFFVYAYYILP